MPSISDIVKASQPDLASYEELCKYSFNSVDTSINGDPDKWFHTHPELSFQEAKTAEAIVKHLETFKAFTIHTSIGGQPGPRDRPARRHGRLADHRADGIGLRVQDAGQDARLWP